MPGYAAGIETCGTDPALDDIGNGVCGQRPRLDSTAAANLTEQGAGFNTASGEIFLYAGGGGLPEKLDCAAPG